MNEKIFKFLMYFAAFLILMAEGVNMLFGGALFAGALAIGNWSGFDSFMIAASIFTGSVFLGEMVSCFVFQKKDSLYARTPNMFCVMMRSIWLGIMSFVLFIVILESDDMPKKFYIFVCAAAITGIINNSLFLIFHTVFCFSKIRSRIERMHKRDTLPATA